MKVGSSRGVSSPWGVILYRWLTSRTVITTALETHRCNHDYPRDVSEETLRNKLCEEDSYMGDGVVDAPFLRPRWPLGRSGGGGGGGGGARRPRTRRCAADAPPNVIGPVEQCTTWYAKQLTDFIVMDCVISRGCLVSLVCLPGILYSDPGILYVCAEVTSVTRVEG